MAFAAPIDNSFNIQVHEANHFAGYGLHAVF